MRQCYRPVGFRAPPRLSRRLPVAPVSLCRRPLAFNVVEFRSPRASAAVYLLRPFPSSAVRWPPTPLNFVRPRASVAVYLFRPFSLSVAPWSTPPKCYLRPRACDARHASRDCVFHILFSVHLFWLAICRIGKSPLSRSCAAPYILATGSNPRLFPPMLFPFLSCIRLFFLRSLHCYHFICTKRKEISSAASEIRQARIAKCNKHRTKQGHLASLVTITALAPLLPNPLNLSQPFYVTKVE